MPVKAKVTGPNSVGRAENADNPGTMLDMPYADRNPIEAILAAPGNSVLAVICGVEGPSYRPVGAMMTVLSDTDLVGSLSSGCVESDIALHAMETLKEGKPRIVRYGRGSPYMDIRLPCGGGLEICLLPTPDRDTLRRVAEKTRARIPCSVHIDLMSGSMSVEAPMPTARDGNTLVILFQPHIRCLVFGKGPEASTFAALARSAGYDNELFSPDRETLEIAARAGCKIHTLASATFPTDAHVDSRTAIVLFFHDHDWEPPLLAGALETNAFYIGAQGSRQVRNDRLAALVELGVPPSALDRLHGPVGLIPSARDPATLAVSVLAEILAKAMAPGP